LLKCHEESFLGFCDGFLLEFHEESLVECHEDFLLDFHEESLLESHEEFLLECSLEYNEDGSASQSGTRRLGMQIARSELNL
jgi:hypothetical protein